MEGGMLVLAVYALGRKETRYLVYKQTRDVIREIASPTVVYHCPRARSMMVVNYSRTYIRFNKVTTLNMGLQRESLDDGMDSRRLRRDLWKARAEGRLEDYG